MTQRFWFVIVPGATVILAIVAVIMFEVPTRLESIPPSVSAGQEVSSAEAQFLYHRAKQETRRNYVKVARVLLERGHPLLAWSFVNAGPGVVFELNKDVNGNIAAAVSNCWGVYRMEIPVPHYTDRINGSGVKGLLFIQWEHPRAEGDEPNTTSACSGR
jgi:hypothetical protein